jgi:hypothetical protein
VSEDTNQPTEDKVKKILATTALAGALISGQAQAADITSKKITCETIKDCYSIDIKGRIEQDDFVKLEKIIEDNQIKSAAIFLDSPGGNLISGIIMGFIIRKNGFATVVEADKYCVSVCASMWLAGKQKFISTEGHVGFHQPYYKDRRGNPHSDPKAISLMKEYYAKIGVPKPAADFFVAADPKDAYWLNADLASGFKIDVETLDAPKKEERQTSKFEERWPSTSENMK